jgi:copper chaperone CopZ
MEMDMIKNNLRITAAPGAAPIELVHQIAGRLRFRAASLQGNARACVELRSALRGVEGVTQVRVNTYTGSLIIEHDPKRLGAAEIIEMLAQHGYALSPAVTTDVPCRGSIEGLTLLAGRALAGAFIERAALALIEVLVLA